MTCLVSRPKIFRFYRSRFITFRWDRASIGINARAIFGHIVSQTTHGRIVIGPMAYFPCVFWAAQIPSSRRLFSRSFVSGFDKKQSRFLHSSWFIRFAPDFWSKLQHWWPHHNWSGFIFALLLRSAVSSSCAIRDAKSCLITLQTATRQIARWVIAWNWCLCAGNQPEAWD